MPKVRLQGSDGEPIEVDTEILRQTMLAECEMKDEEEPIPIPNVTGGILQKVIQWCSYHKDDPPSSENDNDIGMWDMEFLQVDQETLYEITAAANYLNIKGLLNVTCKTLANMIKGQTPEEMRRTFNLQNDFTPQEEEQVRKENEWCDK